MSAPALHGERQRVQGGCISYDAGNPQLYRGDGAGGPAPTLDLLRARHPQIAVDPEAEEATKYGVAVVAGLGAAFAAYQAKKKRDSAAVVDLYNEIVALDEPYELTQEMVAAVGSKYGINMNKSEVGAGREACMRACMHARMGGVRHAEGCRLTHA